MSLEAYAVAVRLSLTNQLSQGLAIVARELGQLENKTLSLQEKFNALKLVGAGWALKHAGDGMMGFLSKSVHVSKEYTHQIAQLGIMGMKQAEVAEVISTAWKTSRDVITTSAADNIQAFRELRGAFGAGHEHEALQMLPIAQRASAIISSLTGKMTTSKEVGYDIAKAAELSTSGGMTQEKMAKRAEQFMQASIAFGGKVTMADFHNAIKMTRGSAMRYGDEFISHYLPTLIQEMKTGHGGGQQAGTLLRNFDRTVIQQVIPLNRLQNWEEAGLINPGHVVWNKHHTGLKRITPGGVAGQDVAADNPYEWWQKFGEPAVKNLMKKKGLTDLQAISALSTNQMTADLFKKFHFQHQQFERDKKLIQEVTAAGGSKEKYEKLLKTDPLLAQKAMEAQWSNIQAEIGYTILPKLLPLAVKFSNWLNDISIWMEKNPGKLQALVIAFGGLAVSLDLIGKAMMLAGMVKLLSLGPVLARLAAAAGVAEGAIGAASGAGLLGAIAGIALPVAAAVAALGLLAGAIYAFRDISKEEADSYRKDGPDSGAKLTKDAQARIDRGELNNFDQKIGKKQVVPEWFKQQPQSPVAPQAQQLAKIDLTAPKMNIPAPPPRQQQTIQVNTQLNLDGRKIGEAVTRHQVREASKPLTGMSGFDTMSQVLLPGMPSKLLPTG
ncbi:hypothetical protein JFK97_06850 [Chromobacterium phragmitis]|uniref:hypothetical protein n=1 Tax=Chromobacterium amazonense TaxID=1382803 RepID=UPI0021B7E596|nr:hypothetical protein [Chromobacterium amazonense]MBM2884106.1 hypothetical protein [Chromobacterium amazonense]